MINKIIIGELMEEKKDEKIEKKTRTRKPAPKAAQKAKKPHEKTKFSFKIFGKWDPVEIADPSFRGYINLEPKLLPRSEGNNRGRFHKSKTHITERLALKLLVSGHAGKMHRLSSGRFGGNFSNVLSVVENALTIIESKEKKNPLEVLVKAIENAAVREEVVSYQKGSVMAREAVITSPQRRIDKTLRYFAQSSYRKSFQKKKSLSEALAEELISAYKGSTDSFAMKEKERIEREASGAR